MKPLIVHPAAQAELDAAMAWYEERRSGLGLAFQDQVQVVFDAIEVSPQRGWSYGDDGYRVLPTTQFPYLIYFLETDDAVWIAAIAHERRRPGYWRDRLDP